MPKPVLRILVMFLAVASIVPAAGTASADCPDDATMAALAADILAARPAAAPKVATIEDGLCAQDKLVALLSKEWGAPSGYKAGLTSEPAQKAFGVTEPVRGVLFSDMMLEPGTTVSAAFGALPRFEADLVAVVGDAGINQATTPEEVLAHLTAVHPFIELPDLVVAAPSELSGPVITAINVGARYGVLGEAIAVEQGDAFLEALAGMTVTVTDQSGKELASAPGKAVLDHPLNVVLWLRQAGVTFNAGDLVSVGSFGPLLKPEPGMTATVTYQGLPGDPAISVTFE